MDPTEVTDETQPTFHFSAEDEQMLKDQEAKMRTLSKKGITANNFKMHKKLAQGIKVLCKIEEKTFSEVITQTPGKNVMMLHFGSGDEDDYNGLAAFLTPFGNWKLHIFPGIPYGIVEFDTVEQAEELIKATTKMPDNIVANSIEIQFGKRVRNVFFFYSQLGIGQLNRQKQTDIPDATTVNDVPGLEIIPEYITPEEEQALMKAIDKNKWNPLAQRKVQHYGYEFIYGLNSVNKNKQIGPLPDFIPGIIDKVNVISQKHNNGKDFDQLTINDYHPGQGIPPHVDTHSPFEECLLSLSLGSGVVMTFKNEKGIAKHIFLPPRSVAIFTKEARFAFYHSIASRKLDRVDGSLFFRRRRVSLTFRRVRHEPCTCQWPIFCDSQSKNPLPAFEEFKKEGSDEDNEDAEGIEVLEDEEAKTEENKTKLSEWEKKFVYKTYDKIAPHFSSTRYKPWPRVVNFLNTLPKDSIVADVGCGNGKYLFPCADKLLMIGTDRSINFMGICVEREFGTQVFAADSLKLPFRDQAADAAISIAVIHHFSNRKLRIQAIKELTRITRIGGKILIYVWAFEQDGRKFTQQDVLVPWHLQYKFEDEGKLQTLLKDRSEGASNAGDGSQLDPKEAREDASVKSQPKETNEKSEKSQDGDKKVEVSEAQAEEHKKELEEGELHVNETKQAIVYKRYYHMFKHQELEGLVAEVPNVEIEESFYDHANWCVRLNRKY